MTCTLRLQRKQSTSKWSGLIRVIGRLYILELYSSNFHSTSPGQDLWAYSARNIIEGKTQKTSICRVFLKEILPTFFSLLFKRWKDKCYLATPHVIQIQKVIFLLTITCHQFLTCTGLRHNAEVKHGSLCNQAFIALVYSTSVVLFSQCPALHKEKTAYQSNERDGDGTTPWKHLWVYFLSGQ